MSNVHQLSMKRHSRKIPFTIEQVNDIPPGCHASASWTPGSSCPWTGQGSTSPRLNVGIRNGSAAQRLGHAAPDCLEDHVSFQVVRMPTWKPG